MKKESIDVYKGYSTMNPVAIPKIPCIDPLTLANNLATKHHIQNYLHKLLCTDINDYDKIYLIVFSHRYKVRLIEKFDYGEPGNTYCYFMIDIGIN